MEYYYQEEDHIQDELVLGQIAFKQPDESNVWSNEKPSPVGYFVYAVLVPVLATFGVFSNFLTAVVFMRPRMTPSAFTYLAAMSWMDFFSCLMIVFSSLANSIFLNVEPWTKYDVQLQIPLIGITTGAANLILLSVSMDRLIYIKNGLPQVVPKFCTRRVARSVVFVIIIFTGIFNIPYFFIFEMSDEGYFEPTTFFKSQYYMVHNWINFILLGLFPAIFLMAANAIMLSVIRKWSTAEQSSNKKNDSPDRRRFYYQRKLTMTIVGVIFLYFIGELPTFLASRKSAISLLFGGDMSGAESQGLENFRIVSAILNAIQLSFNIVIYATLNPIFITELFECLKKVADSCQKYVGINFIVRHFCCDKKLVERTLSNDDCENIAETYETTCKTGENIIASTTLNQFQITTTQDSPNGGGGGTNEAYRDSGIKDVGQVDKRHFPKWIRQLDINSNKFHQRTNSCHSFEFLRKANSNPKCDLQFKPRSMSTSSIKEYQKEYQKE